MEGMLENKFAIRRVTKTTDLDYTRALSIYNATTPVDIKTNTNELTSWIGRKDAAAPFELLVFTLYLDGNVAGLAMMCYVKRQKIAIYDYIALEERYRLNAVFFSYFSLIQSYFVDMNYNISYFVVEISNKKDGTCIDKESVLFKKLICLEGFGMINTEYRVPPLGTDSPDSCFDAYLYVKTNDSLHSVSRDTFIGIVRAIYYDYYTPWYSAFLSDEDLNIYKENLNIHYESIVKGLSSAQHFDVVYTTCAAPTGRDTEKTHGVLPAGRPRAAAKKSVLTALLLLAPIALAWAYVKTMNGMGFPIDQSALIAGCSIQGVFSAAAVYLVKQK